MRERESDYIENRVQVPIQHQTVRHVHQVLQIRQHAFRLRSQNQLSLDDRWLQHSLRSESSSPDTAGSASDRRPRVAGDTSRPSPYYCR